MNYIDIGLYIDHKLYFYIMAKPGSLLRLCAKRPTRVFDHGTRIGTNIREITPPRHGENQRGIQIYFVKYNCI